MSSFMDSIKEESKRYGGGSGNSDFFQFEKGVNKMRILVQPAVIAFHFFGEGQKPDVCVGIDEGCPHHKDGDKKPAIKLATYIIDRKDGRVKLAELPLSISYSLNDLQEDSDFAFDVFPMPYDVKITSDPDNTDPKAKYRLVASPQREDITTEEENLLKEAMAKMTPEKYVEIRKNKQQTVEKVEVAEETKPEEISFD
jgi:hypothetical protein